MTISLRLPANKLSKFATSMVMHVLAVELEEAIYPPGCKLMLYVQNFSCVQLWHTSGRSMVVLM